MTFRQLITNILLFPVMPMLQYGGGNTTVEETAQQKQEQQNNVKLFNYYKTTYKPFIDKTISNVEMNANSNAQAKAVAGQVNAEVMKGASAKNPTQNDPLATTRQMTKAAEVESSGQVTAEGKVKARQIGEQQNIVDIGRGQETTAQSGMEQIAGQSLTSAIAGKEAELSNRTTLWNAAGSAMGAGAAVANRSMNKPDPAELEPVPEPGSTFDPYASFNNRNSLSGGF